MKEIINSDVITCFEDSFTELYYLESLIKLTKEACLEREISANYYNLSDIDKLNLSEERNHYINMLTMALDKVSNIKAISLDMEKCIPYYSNIPTIAADK